METREQGGNPILKGQRKQIYEYLRDNPGATVREMRDRCYPGVQKPCMRMSELKKTHGVDIVDIGRNRHGEKMYKLNTQLTRRKSVVTIENGIAVERFVEIDI
jgi:predicted transcriptional regulator